MTITVDAPDLGEGVYSFVEAKEILSHRDRPVTERKLRYWMTTGLTPPTYHLDGDTLLSFLDLISLEVVSRFTDVGTTIQRIRKFEAELRDEFPDLERPFAYKLFYTDGAALWAQRFGEDETVVELLGRRSDRRHKALAWGPAIATFADEIRFDTVDQRATGWDLSPWVEIDPLIQFGAPVVKGTRIPVRTIVANLEVASPAEVADWYDLGVDQVEGVRDYDTVH